MTAPKRPGILLTLGAVLAATLSACVPSPGPAAPTCDPNQSVDIISPYPVETSPPDDSPVVLFDMLEHLDIPRSEGAQLSASVYVGMSHFYLGAPPSESTDIRLMRTQTDFELVNAFACDITLVDADVTWTVLVAYGADSAVCTSSGITGACAIEFASYEVDPEIRSGWIVRGSRLGTDGSPMLPNIAVEDADAVIESLRTPAGILLGVSPAGADGFAPTCDAIGDLVIVGGSTELCRGSHVELVALGTWN